MRYADTRCRYIELNTHHRYAFKGRCIQCKKEQTVEILAPELYQYRKGESIQNALHSVSSGDREFLMSGICSTCFDTMFSEEED